MNTKRAVLFGVMLWVIIFVVFSVILFLPALQGKEFLQYVIYWILLIPIVLYLAKWYFREDPPTLKKGVLLGVYALVVGTVLDLIITIPLFIAAGDAFSVGLQDFYGDWELWFGFAEVLLLTSFAGFEFDATYTKKK